jgi:hypothetical protein
MKASRALPEKNSSPRALHSASITCTIDWGGRLPTRLPVQKMSRRNGLPSPLNHVAFDSAASSGPGDAPPSPPVAWLRARLVPPPGGCDLAAAPLAVLHGGGAAAAAMGSLLFALCIGLHCIVLHHTGAFSARFAVFFNMSATGPTHGPSGGLAKPVRTTGGVNGRKAKCL